MTRTLAIEDLADLAVPSQPALSPDGSRLVHVVRTQDLVADKPVDALWMVADGKARRLTHGTSDSAPAWSPDGSTLAFVREQQLWLLPAAGGDPRQLTTLPLGAGAPVWSPDGSTIAFSGPVDTAAVDGEDAEVRNRRAGAPIVIEGLEYQADGVGYLRTMRMQVQVVDVATGAVRAVTDGDHHAQSPAWSADGTMLAFTARAQDDTSLDPRCALHLVDATDPKATPRVVAFAEGYAATVDFTPEGTLLVVGYAGTASGHLRLYVVDPASGEATDLVPDLDRNVMPGAAAYPGALPTVTADGHHVLFCIRDRGCTHLYSVPLAGGEPRLVHGGDGQVVSGLSVAGDRAVIVLATPESFGELAEIDLESGATTTLTQHGEALAEVALFPRESREFTIGDGTVVQAWLMRSPDTTGPSPLLVDIHGGPHNAWNAAADEMHLYHHDLVARGWTVLLVNPRGSDGYGERFFDALFGAWGEADARDFLDPIDDLVAEGIADPKRLAVTGYSYGGFMACYLTSRDTRFAAAVPGGVVVDAISMGGTSDDAHALSVTELGLLPWQDAERLSELSPYAQVANVVTPTLVLQGADDVRCPIGQAQQWHYALAERGVPTRMVLYPGASHIFPLAGQPSHRLDYYHRVVDWVEQWAGSAAGPRPAPIVEGHWQRRLSAIATKAGVPGAQLGILRVGSDGAPDQLVRGATGVLHAGTGVPTTVDAVFQIGSITKVWTATVIMRLVDEGKLSLDTPVVEVIPDLTLSTPEMTKGVTIRHLLTHTSGIDGDVFTDTGRGDDCLEKYVALLADAARNHPLGATWSYCNSGYSVLGLVIEKLTGKTWDAALKEMLFEPLGLTHTGTLPDDALLHAAAMGHVSGGENPVVAPVWALPRSMGPAGLINGTVADVLAFARMHLAGGVAVDGTRILSEAATSEMTTFQTEVPDKYLLGDSWGLGWIRYDWHGHRLIGHDGNTIGQAAFLRILPEAGLAVALLTNGGNAHDLYEELYGEIFDALAGVQIQDPLVPPTVAPDTDLTPYLGAYERESVLTEILEVDGKPVMRTTLMGPLAELEPEPVTSYEMLPVAQGLYAVRPDGMESYAPVTFYTLPTGEEYVHFGARATPRKQV
ncbi:MAG: serine hydrolase [Nocardioides sp.]